MPPLLAVDIGGTKTIVAAVDRAPTDGFMPLRSPVRFATPRDPDRFMDELAAASRIATGGEAPVAIGIGAPGPLDHVTGVIEHSTNLGWRRLALAGLVSERFGGVPVKLHDDGNVGALGEARAGAGRGADPFAFLVLGTGLGAGVIADGRIIAGAHGAAGELGHLAVGDRVGPRCSCRSSNCVEAWCGGIGMSRRARDTWPTGRLADGRTAPRDAGGVFDLARLGDPDAARLVSMARHALAVAVAAVLSSFDPAVISVGGAIGMAHPAFARAAVREGASLVHWTTRRGTELRKPVLGSWSVLAGAAVLAAEIGRREP